MKNKFISVIMTSYNSNEKFLTLAIESVLKQSYNNYELIIVDDGSTNGVLAKVLKNINNENINVITQKNSGLCNARNTGISNSKGEYIAFIDDDDIWLPNKLEECCKKFINFEKEDKKIGMVFSQAEIIDENEKVYGIYGFKVAGDIYSKLLGKNIVGPPSSVFIKKSVLDEVGYFNKEYIYAEDIELWYRVSSKYTIYSIDEPLIQYRYRLGSLSKNYRKMGSYTERALISTIKNNNESKHFDSSLVLSKYYVDFAYLYFSNNDSKYYREYFYKAIKAKSSNVLNLKLIFGFGVSLLGDKVMKIFNNKRREDNIIPPSYLKIHDFT